MHKNNFDIVMAHIEENVNQPTAQIKKEIANLIGRHSRAFNEHFNMITGYTLDYYIKQRRLNYAAKDLLLQPGKSICDIALEYQFSDQSAFTRAIKDKYGVTPNEIRKGGLWCFEERICFSDFTGKKNDTAVAKLLKSLEIGEPIWNCDVELIEQIEHLHEEYGIDIDTCYQIADLAERLGVPICYFGQQCLLAAGNYQDDFMEIPPDVEFMARAGFESLDEMYAMCEYFKCEYYELDELKVYKYRKMMSQQK